MKFYNDKIVKKIRKLRKDKGLSLGQLESKFGIRDSTISRWIQDIDNNNPTFLSAQRRENKAREQYIKTVKLNKISISQAKLLCALLYWCEGSKYPSSNTLAFSNSDISLITTFLFLLRKAFNVDEDKLRIHLQLHTTHNRHKTITYWSKLLNIPKDKFYKSTITKPTHVMKRLNYRGTCTIKYHDVKLLLGLMGIYESLANKIDGFWRGRIVA